MNISSSMNKFPSRKEFTVLPKDAILPEESELTTPVQNNVKDRDQPDEESRSNKDRDQPDEELRSNKDPVLQKKEPCCTLEKAIKYCIQIGVLVTVLVFQIKDWPQEPDVYKTDDPLETSRGGQRYTCGCSLPASLGLGAAHEDRKPDTSLNICYEKSNLDTVKILTYSNSAAAAIKDVFADLEPAKLKQIYNLAVSGYKVTQEAYDLYGAIAHSNPIATNLTRLFIGGYKQPSADAKLADLLDPSFMSFPKTYVRLNFQYYCNNCALCGPHVDLVNNLSNVISNKEEWWASCFRWDTAQQEGNWSRQICEGDESFYGKCLAYPTETLPPNFAISKFLQKFLDLPGINRSLDLWREGARFENTTLLEPSHLYLNISQVQNSLIQLNFVEVIKNSVLWVLLLDMFPTLDNECATLDYEQVCNGTSVCNLFTGASAYKLKCLDMDVIDQCKQLMTARGTGTSTVDNTGKSNLGSRLKANSWLDLECPGFNCERNVLPYFVTWNTSDEMEKDALNRFLSRKFLNRDWAKRSGVCTKTYSNVLRDATGLGQSDDNGTMYLETNCTSSNMSTSGSCWLTGRYHNINDNPTDDWKELADLGRNDRFSKPHDHKLFICYIVKKEGYRRWFINTFAVLFSWIGTVELIWRSLAEKIKSRNSKKK